MKRIVLDIKDIQGNKKEEEIRGMLIDSGVTLHKDDNYGDNNFYGGALEDDIDETVAVTDDSAVVSEPTFEEEVIEAQEDDNVTSQIEAPTTKLPEQPKQEEKIVSKEEDDKTDNTDEPELFNDDTEEEDEVHEEKEEEEEEYEIPFDYLSLKEKYPLDIWGLIDTYFRDNEYYKSKHQLDSFNEFIYSKTNGIEYIIKRENPLIIYKEPISDGTKFKYEISIYFGERFDKDGNKFSDNNIFLSTPSIYDSNDKEMSYMFPNDARLRSLTYAMYIFCNIGITFKIDGKEKLIYKNYEKINIGILPIMVHSKPCLLNGLESQKLTELGECPYDQGGYFIIKGKEKVILSQEKKVNNILYITKSSDPKIILQGNLKSVSKEGFQSSRTNVISYENVKIESGKNLKHFLVRILGIDIKLPLFILFRALGVETDREILNMIIYDTDSQELKNKLLDELFISIKDSQPIYTQKNAYKLISMNTKGKENINTIDILNNNFLPNYETDNFAKAKFLAYSVRKILLTHLKVINYTDRDSYSYKRIDTPGSLLLELYRELWGKYQRNVSLTIDKEYKFNIKEAGNDIQNIINEKNIKSIFDNKIMNQISNSFGGVFGTGISARQGIVQDLNRNSMLGTLSHIRRLITPLPGSSKTIGPRRLHNSQWGFVCPTESPDGGNVGIVNHLSIISTISFNITDDGIYEALKDHDLLSLKDIITENLYNLCKVFINGKWIGLHKDPEFLLKIFKLFKLNSIINIYTSISWDSKLNEFYIFTDSGRIVRPVLKLKYNKDGEKINDLILGNTDLMSSWKKCIHGYMLTRLPEISVYNNEYFKDYLKQIKDEHKDDYLEFLENNAAPIEYIDSIESEYCFISKDIYSIDKNYTHSEIHSSLILSPLALSIPFPEHSQYPRNVFSCQQTKQAVSVYSSAYNTRFDTFGHILNYPQKPIVATRYKKYTNVDRLPNGMNIVVAICSYTGYNQEDSIIINRSSVERGMFNSMYFRSYEDSESKDAGDRPCENCQFINPKNLSDILKKSKKNFDKLDENGIVKEGEYVDYDDVIVSKMNHKTLPNGKIIKDISGKTVKFMSSGKVDKVVVTKNRDNLRNCKIRIFKEKIPDVGDKYASRCGQKGMCGLLLEQHQMPFTNEGIVPDLMINPHAIPSRMTINQLLEVVLGKSSVMAGYYGDATPFQNNDISVYSDLLETFGYEKYGNEVMYSGITGEQLKTSIFIGPTYYQRLKIMVADKMFSRGRGKMQSLTRQPAAGRANEGGLRIGEMERDSILGHGTAGFLNESVMERSDKYKVQIDKYTGLISYDNNSNNKTIVEIPYTCKLLLQELETMGIAPRVITPAKITNHVLFDHLNQIYTNQYDKNINYEYTEGDDEEDN